MHSEHTTWLSRITNGDSAREIARRAGLNAKTLTNQMNAGTLKPEVIIEVAQAYNESPVYALVDLGYISAKWVADPGVATALARATDAQLTDELLRRLQLIADADIPIDEYARKHVRPEFYAVADHSPEEKEGDYDDYIP